MNYYLLLACRGTNVHGEKLYEHIYCDSIEEAERIAKEETDKGNEVIKHWEKEHE